VLCDFYRISGNSDQLLNDEQLAVDELAYLAQAGGTALVECTTLDLAHIIMSTGWYRQPFYPEAIDRTPTRQIAQQFIREMLR
jgi:hypothetical protein